MGRQSLYSAKVVGALVLAVLCLCLTASGQRVKVNKEQITIFSPDAASRAAVVAEPGAIANAGADVGVYAENTRTSQRTDIMLNEDGSFRVILKDTTAGDQIRIYASRPRVNRSYGTFIVPAEPQGAAELMPLMARGPGQPLPSQAADASGRLAVMAVVIDTTTGQIVDSAHITGAALSPVENPDHLRGMAARLLDRCLGAAKQELRQSSAVLHQAGSTQVPVVPEAVNDGSSESQRKEETALPLVEDPNQSAMPSSMPTGDDEAAP